MQLLIHRIVILTAIVGVSFFLVAAVTWIAFDKYAPELVKAVVSASGCWLGGLGAIFLLSAARGSSWQALSPLLASLPRLLLPLIFVASACLFWDRLVSLSLALYTVYFYLVVLVYETFVAFGSLPPRSNTGS